MCEKYPLPRCINSAKSRLMTATNKDAKRSTEATRAAVEEAQADLDLAVRLNPNTIKAIRQAAENETDDKKSSRLALEANTRQADRDKLARLSLISTVVRAEDSFEDYTDPDEQLALLRAQGDRHAASTYDAFLQNARDDYDLKKETAQDESTPREILLELARNHDDADDDHEIRAAVAGNASTPTEILSELATDDNRYVRAVVGQNPNTPSEILSELSKDEDDLIRKFVTGNRNTPPEALYELSKDEDLKLTAAQNPSLPSTRLHELASDEKGYIREKVAENRSTPPETLRTLASDEGGMVRLVANNPSAPRDLLRDLSEHEEDDLRFYVSRNPSTPPECLDALSADNDMEIREKVAQNPSTTLATLSKLSDSSDPDVASYASDGIRERFTRADYLKQLDWKAEDYEDVPDEWLIKNI